MSNDDSDKDVAELRAILRVMHDTNEQDVVSGLLLVHIFFRLNQKDRQTVLDLAKHLCGQAT